MWPAPRPGFDPSGSTELAEVAAEGAPEGTELEDPSLVNQAITGIICKFS